MAYPSVYPGIDLLYYGNDKHQLEYDFVVAPGANPAAIQLAFQGPSAVDRDALGNLVLHTPYGDVAEHAPIVYQVRHGVRQPVAGGYVVPDAGHVGFQVGPYDHSLPLIIDPVWEYDAQQEYGLLQQGNAIAVDASGNAYVAGTTTYDRYATLNAFVAKLAPDGSLIYSTLLGGSSYDLGNGIALDSQGNIYVAGSTHSSDFPTAGTPAPFQGQLQGVGNAFVAKLNPTGTDLVYSTYLGSFDDMGLAIAVDGDGSAYVTGSASSPSNAPFPTTPGAFQTAGGQAAFITKLTADGTGLVYSTLLGGTYGNSQGGATSGRGIAVDRSGNAYVTGDTSSPIFPTWPDNPVPQKYGGGDSDAFVTALNASGSGLIYSTYLGGSRADVGEAIALDATNNAYVTGYTASGDFPTTIGVVQPRIGGSNDAFVAKIDPSGSVLVFATFLGGGGDDDGYGIAVDNTQSVYVTGQAVSADFPKYDPFPGGGLMFVTKLNPTATAFAYSTLLGNFAYSTLLGNWNGWVVGQAIAVDPAWNAYVVGGSILSPGDFRVAKLRTRQIYSNSEPPFGDYGDPQDTGGSGPGVYLHDGEFRDRETDLQIPGRGLNWQFVRSYRSGADFDGPLGQNWDFNYDRHLWVVGPGNLPEVRLTFPGAQLGDVVRVDGLARADLYVRNGDGSFTSPAGFFTRLVQNPAGTPPGTFTERDRTGLTYTYLQLPTRDVAVLTRLPDPNGNALTFVYDKVVVNATATGGTPTTLLDANTFYPSSYDGYTVTITGGTGVGQTRTVRVTGEHELTVDRAWDTPPDNTSTYWLYLPDPYMSYLQSVFDTLGRRIDYWYSLTFRLTHVMDFYNRDIFLDVNTQGDLDRVVFPFVDNTPVGNDLPPCNVVAYTYSSGFADPRLNHELKTITAPNEFASHGPPRVAVGYDQNAASPTAGRVLTQTVGEDVSAGFPAGGMIRYAYPAVSQTEVTDRNGNVTEYQFDRQGDIVRKREYTDPMRIPRALPPNYYYETDSVYNADYELVHQDLPGGNSIDNVYYSGPDRYEQGNLLSTTEHPGPRGGDQAAITVSYTYEPVYNQVGTITDPRGTDMNYRPPILLSGEMFPDAARYQTVFTFDYQEGTNYDALAQQLGITSDAVQALLRAANVDMGLGDINGDQVTNQTAGNIIRVKKPSVNLLLGSNQAVLTGSTVQPIVTLNTYNAFGQLTKTIDPEGNVNQNLYYSVQSPGRGNPDPNGGGYLAQTLQDTTLADGRDNNTNPPPANISHAYTYDQVGNVVSETDGRGIETDYLVNQLNQVIQVTRAAKVPTQTTTAEPLPLTAYQYLRRNFYDYNNNLVLSQVEDRGNTSDVDGNGLGTIPDQVINTTPGLDPADGGDPQGGPAFADTLNLYDQLDDLIETRVEVDQGHALATRYRYDPNQHPVLTIYPAGNADAAVYDERDLLFQSIQGASSRPAAGLYAAGDPTTFNRPGGTNTPPSTYYANYDQNGNLIETVNPEYHTGGQPSQFEPPPTGGDTTKTTYDGFDRPKAVTDALGNKTITTYDPAGNVVRVVQTGDTGNNSSWQTNAGSTLAVTEAVQDELNRTIATDQVLFTTPYPPGGGPSRTPALTVNPVLAALAPYPAGVAANDAPLPGATDITVLGRVSTLTEYDRASRPTFAVAPNLAVTRTDYDGVGRAVQTTDSALGSGLGPTFAGTATGGTATTLTTGENWGPDQWRGLVVQITSGPGAGQARQITTNSANVLTVSPAWRTPPTNLSAYAILSFAPAGLAGNTVQTAYDANSNPIETKETDVTSVPGVAAESFVTTAFYDALDRLRTVVDNLGQASDYAYDSRGNLVAQADANGPTTGMYARSFNRRGLGSGSVNANGYGFVTLTSYDGLSRPVEGDTLLPAGNTVPGNFLGGDGDGVKQTIPGNYLDASQAGDGIISSYAAYDADSQLLASRDDNGNATAYVYDNQGRPTKLFQGQVAGYQGTAFSVPGGDSGSFNVGLRGGVAVQAQPTSATVSYDRDGQATGRTDASGNTFATAFDALGRPTATQITLAAGFYGTTRQAWQYDGLSRLTQESTDNQGAGIGTVATQRFYDALSRPVEEQTQVGTLSKAVSWSYDLAASGSADRPSAELYPAVNADALKRQIDSRYDALGRLVSRQDHRFTTGAAYAPLGTVQYIGPDRVATRTYQNGVRLTYIGQAGGGNADVGYDGLGRPVKQVWEQFSGTTALGSGTVRIGFGCVNSTGPAYDRSGNLLLAEKLPTPATPRSTLTAPVPS